MPRFENDILGLIPQTDWLNVGFDVTRQNDPIDGLFADQRTEHLVAEWESIASEYQIPVMAQFHSFDTEAQVATRVPINTHNIEKGLIKEKINQSERMRALLNHGVERSNLYNYVLDDGINLAERVFTRSKVAKNEVLYSGKMTIKENNLNLTVDYGIPNNQLNLTLDFSAGATDDIPTQIEAITEFARGKGVEINTMVCSRAVLQKLRKNAAIQTIINGVYMAGALVRRSALEAYLSEEFGINRIVTNDLLYATDEGINSDGTPKRKSHRYFPENKVSFIATNNAGLIGTGLWGNPPELDDPTIRASFSGAFPYVYVSQHWEWDPHVLWTKASALFIPVVYSPNSLFVATVTE